MVFKKNEVRQFPTKEDFLGEKKMDDRVYGYLQANSYLTEDSVRYCWKINMSAKSIKDGLMRSKEKRKVPSEDKIRNSLKLMKIANLISDGTINKRSAYILTPLVAGEYVFIKTDTLRFLANTCEENVIKVYAFLKQKYGIYETKKCKEKYFFSENGLLEVLGYADNKPRNHQLVRDIIDSLTNNGLIETHKYVREVGPGRMVMFYSLDKVNEDYTTIFEDKKKDDSVLPVIVPSPQTKEDIYKLLGF